MDITIRRLEPNDYEAMQKIFTGRKVVWGTLQLPFPSIEIWRNRIAEVPNDMFRLAAMAGMEMAGQLDLFTSPKHPELGLWATIHKETGKFIGRCGLLPWTIEDQYDVEVVYTIAEEYWGQGLGSEAAQAILNYGFEKLNLSRLICMIEPENIGSQKVAEKIGMSLENKVDLPLDGVDYPVLIYSINEQAVQRT
jgi:RimJ/RimL family protein N-acetyltransferase